MKLRVLGRYGRYPLADSGTSSFLIQTDTDNYILDMGCSSLSNIQKYIAINDIKAVILSHLHGDHIADFKAFTYMVNIMKMEGELNHNIIVYLPKTPAFIYDDLISAKGIEFRIIEDGMSEIIGNSNLSYYKMIHPIETYGVRIENNNKILAYTADTILCDNLDKLMANADVVIGDACILSEDHNAASVHLSVKELALKAKNNYAKKLILAHLPDKNLDKILDEAVLYMNNSILAEEDIEYTI